MLHCSYSGDNALFVFASTSQQMSQLKIHLDAMIQASRGRVGFVKSLPTCVPCGLQGTSLLSILQDQVLFGGRNKDSGYWGNSRAFEQRFRVQCPCAHAGQTATLHAVSDRSVPSCSNRPGTHDRRLKIGVFLSAGYLVPLDNPDPLPRGEFVRQTTASVTS
jgi:hypothetical protein